MKIALAGQALIEEPVASTSPEAKDLVTRISAADAAIANFEGTMGAARAWPLKTKTLHIARPEAMASLRTLGFTALGLANNHAFDLGPPGLLATRLQALACGFAVAGSGENLAAAAAPAAIGNATGNAALLAFDLGPQPDIVYAGADRPGINPLRIRHELVVPASELERLRAIAHACGHTQRLARRVEIGYSDAAPLESLDFFGVGVKAGDAIGEHRYPDASDLTRAIAAIQTARASVELVVVSAHHHHWEADWTAPPRWLQALTAALVDAGADIVFCHGAPVLQSMAFHKARPIFYGLGNFIFHTARAERYDSASIDVWRSALAVCDFEARSIKSVDLHALRVGAPASVASGDPNVRLAPQLLYGHEGELVIDGFLQRSALTGAAIERGNGCCTYPSASHTLGYRPLVELSVSIARVYPRVESALERTNSL